jgi:hypothetical protein
MSGTAPAGPASGTARRRGVVLVVAVAVIVAAAIVAVGAVLAQSRHEIDASANGTGVTFEGRWYWASSSRVADDALGAVVARGVAFQDRTTDLRAVRGFDPAVGLAALLPSLDGSPGGDRWTWVSTDQTRGTDPSAYPDVRAVLAR